MIQRALLVLALLAPATLDARQARTTDASTALIVRLEEAAAAGNTQAILALGTSPDAPGLRTFAALAQPRPAAFIIKERDRTALTPAGERLLIEVFGERTGEAAITTWRIDLVPGEASPALRRIAAMERLTIVDGLHKLALDRARQYEIRNLTVQVTDLTLEIPSGLAFVATTAEGPTAVVLLGRGRMRFAPADAAERTQLQIFGGEDVLTTEFDAAFIRVRPEEFPTTFSPEALIPRPVVPGDLRRAGRVFDEYVGETLTLDLRDLSRERWSLIPTAGDLIAEVRTRRLGSLTYTRSSKDPEDISLFDRRRRRNIAVYASAQKLATRGRFWSEDEFVEYDIVRQDLEVAFTPERMWVEGTANLRIRIRSFALASLTLRLAEPLAVRSVATAEHGRLLHLRVIGQNNVIVNLPDTLPRGTEIVLRIAYGGRLEPQQIEREGIVLDQQSNVQREEIYIPVEPQYLYSNRSYWYPQNTVTDYATGRLSVTVPHEFEVVGTGIEAAPPKAAADGEQGQRRLFVYAFDRPVRYLACVISRFNRVVTRQLGVESPDRSAAAAGRGSAGPAAAPETTALQAQPSGEAAPRVTLSVHANPRQVSRGRALADRTASIIEYYAGIMGDAPYPGFTLAVTESDLPGGHSPAYFAILNQPMPLSPLFWRNDPVAFDAYPHYFLAHEVAHQWWGQGVGWKNYHEQWLSEGFAQYFAALYAARERGDEMFTGMLRQMRRWSIDQSSQGPIYLGYRLGHIKAEGRVFRALIYNKGAMVLHMLRRLVGDEKFFGGLREFYRAWTFRKAGTDDFRIAMERATGANLAAFFDGWIYGAGVPRLTFSSTIAGNAARIRFEHRGAVIPLPVTVSIAYTDGSSEHVVVAVTERIVDRTLPLKGPVRAIEANRDHAAVAEFEK